MNHLEAVEKNVIDSSLQLWKDDDIKSERIQTNIVKIVTSF